jgi:retron-type reverse transcriptase
MRAVRRRQVPVEAHFGTATDFLARHEAEVAAEIVKHGVPSPSLLGRLLHRAGDDRNLRLALEHVFTGGPAAGVDGIRTTDLDHRAEMQMVSLIREVMRSGCYRPNRERPVPIPKASGGTRTLWLPTIADRTVQRAILQVVDPMIDPTFGPGIVGGRRGLSTAHALAMAEREILHGNSFLVIADIRSAFDVVPHDLLMGAVYRRLGRTPLTAMIRRIVRTNRSIGIGQGGPLSPLLLNILLDDLLDQPFARLHPDLLLIRYLDDLLVASSDRVTADRVFKDLETLLKNARMPLKPTTRPVVDLQPGAVADWLGFSLTRTPTGLEARIGTKAWNKLELDLADAHRSDTPDTRPTQIIQGWLAYLGPCYRHTDRERTLQRIRDMADTHGHLIPSETDLDAHWGRAADRYEAIRAEYGLAPTPAMQTTTGTPADPAAASPAAIDFSTSRTSGDLVSPASDLPDAPRPRSRRNRCRRNPSSDGMSPSGNSQDSPQPSKPKSQGSVQPRCPNRSARDPPLNEVE